MVIPKKALRYIHFFNLQKMSKGFCIPNNYYVTFRFVNIKKKCGYFPKHVLWSLCYRMIHLKFIDNQR